MYDENQYFHLQTDGTGTGAQTQTGGMEAEMRGEAPTGGQETGSKKEKRQGTLAKSAGNGLVFGLCAALIFCLITAVANRTFLKPQAVETAGEQIGSAQTAKEQTVEGKDSDDMAADGAESAAEADRAQAAVLSDKSGALSVSQIAQNVMPSVVSITIKGVEEVHSMFGTRQYESQGAGSGIIVGQNDTELLIATNSHVVSGANEVSVCFDDSDEKAVVSAEVRGSDPANDLAILTVQIGDISGDIMGKIKVASMGDSDSLMVGEQVVAIGNALGYGQSVTTGIVSALNREVDIEGYSAKLIQTDAAINPGNSGGALLNMKGELIGINSAKYASAQVEGMGYAIPIATAKPILDNLMNREKRELADEAEAGFLGVSCQNVSDEAEQLYGMPKGAYITEVEQGSAADKAGLKKGDIITKFDGITITQASDLRENISYYKQGESVEVVLMRSENGEYREKTVTVTLAKSAAIEKQREQSGSDQQNAQNAPKLPYGWNQAEPDQGGENGSGRIEDYMDQLPEEVQDWLNGFFGG